MMNRREFVVAAASVVVCATCPSRGLSAEGTSSDPIDCGSIDDYAAGGIVTRFIKTGRFFLVTEGGKLFAPVARCPHEGVRLRYDEETRDLQCTEHTQSFTIDGKVKAGKHVRKALPRLGVSINDAGHVLVDPSVRYIEAKWSEEGSWVAVGEGSR